MLFFIAVVLVSSVWKNPLCYVIINSILLNPLCVWILFKNASSHSCLRFFFLFSDKRTAEHFDRRVPVIDSAAGAGHHGDGCSGQADQGSAADGEYLHGNQQGQIL